MTAGAGGAVAAAYSANARAWREGPERVYGPLAEHLCDRSPVPLDGAIVLDLGAGTGAATKAARRRGARTVALDIAPGMLAAGPRGSAVVADATRLPFAPHSFDVVIAAFSLNHLDDPTVALREAARVLRRGGGLVVGAYAEGDSHPVKAATEAAARDLGWHCPGWYTDVRQRTVPELATVEKAEAHATAAGLAGARVIAETVELPGLGVDDLIAWRLGMPYLAGFVAGLSAADHDALLTDARRRLLATNTPLARQLIVVVAES